MDDDAVLMRRVADGDAGAFRTLVERYQRGIFNFFLRSTGNTEDSEDLTQQLFLNLLQSASRYQPKASFKTYIYRIASNMAVSSARKRKTRSGGVSLDQLIEEGYEPRGAARTESPVAAVERRELQRAYAAALLELPPDWRTALELKVGKGLSYREIGDVMDKSVSAVESILFRARERLAEELKAFMKEKDNAL
jgi:RNA polymerase sigma-70 factor (ECF subfamily)